MECKFLPDSESEGGTSRTGSESDTSASDASEVAGLGPGLPNPAGSMTVTNRDQPSWALRTSFTKCNITASGKPDFIRYCRFKLFSSSSTMPCGLARVPPFALPSRCQCVGRLPARLRSDSFQYLY